MKDNQQDREIQGELIGYHLGLIDETERKRIEGTLGADSTRAACERLERILRPLNADASPVAADGFVDRIMAAVESGAKSLPFPRGALAAPVGQPVTTGGGSLFTMREAMSIAAALLMFAGILVPGYYSARQSTQKIACANNLRMIGNGLVAYSETYDNQMPFAGFVPAHAKWAVADPSPNEYVMRNSRHFYRLVQGKLIPAEAAICSGVPGDRPMQVVSPEAHDDFLDPRNISYATNLVTRPWDRYSFLPEMPIAGCMTPLVDQNRRLVSQQPIQANSGNHGGGTGQNVLRANISVRFFTAPTCGLGDDDIYRVRGVDAYTGSERPQQPDDAMLVP